MARMTEEEAHALDREWSTKDINLVPGEDGIFTRQRKMLDCLDRVTADYITTRAMATNKLPAQIIGEMVRREMAVAL